MITCTLISRVVADHYKLGARLYALDRARHMVEARWAAWYLARKLTDHSLAEIGRRMGGRDHTTVLYGLNEAERLLKESPIFEERVGMISEAVNAEAAKFPQGNGLPHFEDLEPIDLAAKVLDGQLLPVNQEQVTALAMGVRHYANVAAQCSDAAHERKVIVRERLVPVAPSDMSFLPAVLAVVTAYGEVEQVQFTTNESAARRKLEKTLKTLKNALEKLK